MYDEQDNGDTMSGGIGMLYKERYSVRGALRVVWCKHWITNKAVLRVVVVVVVMTIICDD